MPGEASGTVTLVTDELIARARAGDDGAFRELTDPHLRELQVHCYRMLGSFADAEDALQDTLLAAWQGLGGFEGRASLRTWLYRIATNRCLSALRAASRRPAAAWNVPGVEPPEPTRLGEVVWLEPYPDALLEGALDRLDGRVQHVGHLAGAVSEYVAQDKYGELARRQDLQGGDKGQGDRFSLLVTGLRAGRQAGGTLQERVGEWLEPDDLAEPGRLGRLHPGNVPLLGESPAGRAARVEAPVGGNPVQPGTQR